MSYRVVIYARYSSHNQTDKSIEGQLLECHGYAKRNDYTVIQEYVDRAKSAKTDKRPAFQRMILDSGKQQFDYIIVYKLDRFARNRIDSAIYKKMLQDNGVRVLSVCEPITDDANGFLIEGMHEIIAEFYSINHAQNVTRGMKLNAEKRPI